MIHDHEKETSDEAIFKKVFNKELKEVPHKKSKSLANRLKSNKIKRKREAVR